MGTIVVGVDGSTGSDAALRWALDEARLRGSSLRVVHVYQPPRMPLTEAGVGAAGGMGVPVLAEGADELGRAAEADAMNVIEEALRRTGGDPRRGLEIERAAVARPSGADADRIGARRRAARCRPRVAGADSSDCCSAPSVSSARSIHRVQS